MTKRLKVLASHISRGAVFADVGCDHGLICEYVLKNGLFDVCIGSDISKKSLDKAIAKNSKFGDKFVPILSDGFNSFNIIVDECLISGMGGEEIVEILKNANNIPSRLILSPQKNQDKVRSFLVENAFKILSDYTIFDKKFYDIIVAVRGEDSYTKLELQFGRDNLKNKPEAFINKLKSEEDLKLKVLNNDTITTEVRENIEKELKIIRSILYENKWRAQNIWRVCAN